MLRGFMPACPEEEEKEEGPAAKRPRVAPGAVGEGTAC